MTRTSFFNHATITILATLLVYAPLTSCAPGADESGTQEAQINALVDQTLLESSVFPVCADYAAAKSSEFGATTTDKLFLKGQCESGARAVHSIIERGEDEGTATGADVEVYQDATEWASTNRPVPARLVEEVKDPQTVVALSKATQNGMWSTPLNRSQAAMIQQVSEGTVSLREYIAEFGFADSSEASNTPNDVTAAQLGLANAEVAGLGFVGYRAALLVLGLVALLALVACGGVRDATVDIGAQPVGTPGAETGQQPQPTPESGVGAGATGNGTYSAVPVFRIPDGTRQIVPDGGWIDTINKRWQRAANGRANPDRAGVVERGMAAIEDLFETAPDNFTYASVYTPFNDTSLPWIKPQAVNWFIDIPGSPKLGPYNPDQREVTFAGDTTPHTVFWFVVSTEPGKASMLTDILGDELGANNPLTFRRGTKPLLVVTSLESRGESGEDRGHHVVFGAVDDNLTTLTFVDASGIDAFAQVDPNYPQIRRVGAGVASDGTYVTAQPYAVIDSPQDSFDIGFGYIGNDRPGLNFDFHVTFQAK